MYQEPKEVFRRKMDTESTDYLRNIWEESNKKEWTEEQLNTVADILRGRGEKLTSPTELIQNLLITTTHVLQDRKIIKYIGVVSSVVVLGTGFFSELSGGVADFFGTRAGGFQKKLQQAREIALGEILKQTLAKGGNAVIGLDFDYMTLSSNILMLNANGTAVEIDTIDADNQNADST